MRRRELLAGIAGAGVLAAGGAVAIGGPRVFDRSDPSTTTCVDDPTEPIELDSFAVHSGNSGTVTVPNRAHVTFVKFFATWCGICRGMLSDVTEAHDRVGDEVRFLSVTPERVSHDGQVSEDELATWWEEYGGGTWEIGIDDTASLQAGCESWTIPSAIVVDRDGVIRWSHTGDASADELVAGIESALEG